VDIWQLGNKMSTISKV